MSPIIWRFNELAGTTPFSGISWSRCVVDLLNELHEENKHLRKETKALKDANEGLIGTIAK